jgi:hypothetical protein
MIIRFKDKQVFEKIVAYHEGSIRGVKDGIDSLKALIVLQ